ncbi:MAG TPA: MerR family transcriptional regulator [Thermoanaerobaculia bacterium]|nr:MerR family transcriptional regulator [Thermoanaerobaculia bacterium]
MVAKARVQKRLYYKIGEACKALGIQPYVLRYWETEFPALTPSKSRSGQRVYSEKELEIIRRIKELLYDEGYTIAGAKKKLEVELASGALGEDRDDDETTPEAKAPSPAAAAPEKPAPVRRQPVPPAVAEGPSLDTGASKRIETLVSGIEDALREAREIQALLGPKPSP